MAASDAATNYESSLHLDWETYSKKEVETNYENNLSDNYLKHFLVDIFKRACNCLMEDKLNSLPKVDFELKAVYWN